MQFNYKKKAKKKKIQTNLNFVTAIDSFRSNYIWIPGNTTKILI